MNKVFVLSLLSMFITGCVTTPAYNPFSVEKTEIYQDVHTIGLMPMFLGVNVDEPDYKLQEMERYLTSDLKEAGFNVVASTKYKEIYDEYKAAIGPLYDPNTGALNKEKQKVLKEQAMREYLNDHPVDAILYSGVRPVKAEWNGNVATWHGVTAPTTGETGFWANFSANQMYGSIPAISYQVYLESDEETKLYHNLGGIQLTSWYRGGNFVEVPKSQILSDHNKMAQGIEAALKPLLQKDPIRISQ